MVLRRTPAQILELTSFANSLLTSHPGLLPLLRNLGPTFLRYLTSSLLASNGHFSSLLLSTLWGLHSGHTTLCVQGIFGSGKTFSASLPLIITVPLSLSSIASSLPNLTSPGPLHGYRSDLPLTRRCLRHHRTTIPTMSRHPRTRH